MIYRGFPRGLLVAATLAGACAFQTAPAAAQTSIVALVNNIPITSNEVSERRAVVRLVRKKQISAKQALDELIDQQLLFQEAKRRQITVAESDVEQRFAGVAQNAKMSTEQLGNALRGEGSSPTAFKAEIRSGLLQRKLMGMLSRLSTGISEKEIAAGITAKKGEGDAQAYRYTMQQIVFVVTKGSKPAQINQRRAEAESFRRRVESCEQALTLAKGLRDVAPKPPVTRLSSQLSGPFRDMLAGMKVGQSTKAEVSELGVEVIVLCNKQETVDDTALRNEVQNELVQEQGREEVDKFVADLRKRALIIYK